jgi:hypothetical protein
VRVVSFEIVLADRFPSDGLISSGNDLIQIDKEGWPSW